MTRRFWVDLAERAAKTFVGTFATVIVLPADVADVNAWKAAVLAAGTAGVSAVMSLISRKVGPDKGSASTVV